MGELVYVLALEMNASGRTEREDGEADLGQFYTNRLTHRETSADADPSSRINLWP